MKESKLVVGDVEVTVDEAGNVRVSGANIVMSTFRSKAPGGGQYTVQVGSVMWDLDIVLKGDVLSPLNGMRPFALVVDATKMVGGEGIQVHAQDGIGSWNHRHTLLPKTDARAT